MQPPLPSDMPAMMPTYRFFAKTYNWPPDIVNNLPEEVVEWLPLIETAANEADERIQEIHEQRNRRY